MKALIYLYKTTFKNKLKTALKKPITYFWLFFVLIYAVLLPFSLSDILNRFELNTPQGMVYAVTIFCFWLLPANIISYAKRKGLLFQKADAHFLFVSPINPKQVLIFRHTQTLGISLLLTILILVAGLIMFRLSPLSMLLYFIASMGLDNVMQTCIMLLCYGSEKLMEKQRKAGVALAYILMLSFVAIGVGVYFKLGLSLDSVVYFLNCDAIQMVPIVGWYISLMRLIFLGPTTLNIICSSLYVVSVLFCLVLSMRLSCTGDYFEDAEKFAEDFEELKAKRSEGIQTKLGKREKYKKAKVTYQGGGGKAIFYKQLLEYKKTKGFLLDKTNLVMVVLGNIWIYVMLSDIKGSSFKNLLMPLVMGYLVICTSAVNGKWGREIKNPYTFLIPDSSFKKLWYATLMEHFKNLIYGILFALPCAILLKVSPLQTILCILVYMMLQANKLYSLVMMEVFVGNTLGRVGKQLFHMFLQGIPMGLAGMGAVMGMLAESLELSYILMTLVLTASAVVFMVFAACSFEKMETV